MVFLYVQGADNRANDKFDTVQVLKATAVIEAGESIEDASAAGKLSLQDVSRDQLLSGYQTDTTQLEGTKAQMKIFVGEQIVADKFGTNAAAATTLPIPDDGNIAISVNLTDPSRVAGFVNPSSEVAIFLTGTDAKDGTSFSRLLLPRVTVLAVGNTTPVSTTTTDESGASTTEQLPRTLLTISLDQRQAEKVLFAQGNGELAFGLLTPESQVVPADAMTFDELWK